MLNIKNLVKYLALKKNWKAGPTFENVKNKCYQFSLKNILDFKIIEYIWLKIEKKNKKKIVFNIENL